MSTEIRIKLSLILWDTRFHHQDVRFSYLGYGKKRRKKKDTELVKLSFCFVHHSANQNKILACLLKLEYNFVLFFVGYDISLPRVKILVLR